MPNKRIFRNKIIVYTDGGARGNPGPAAIGVVIGEKRYGNYVGERTNNQAEYLAVIFALKKLKHLLGKKGLNDADIEIRADSELVVKQLNRMYKIKENDLKILFVDVWNLLLDFKSVKFAHIQRSKNKEADRIVNEILDKKSRP